MSCDAGETWETHGRIRDDKTWLIENTLCEVFHDDDDDAPGSLSSSSSSSSSSSRLVMLFRTGAGRIHRSTSADKGRTWSSATPTSLPNPNSKVGMTSVSVPVSGSSKTKTRLILAYNPSETRRAPLHLATSDDGGDTWTDAAVVESDPEGNFAYPTPIAVRGPGGGDMEVKVGYSVWGQGICVANVKL